MNIIKYLSISIMAIIENTINNNIITKPDSVFFILIILLRA
jgi:hypothetical protein